MIDARDARACRLNGRRTAPACRLNGARFTRAVG